MKDRYPGYGQSRSPRTTATLAGLAVTLAACSSSPAASHPVAHKSSPPSVSAEPFPGCQPDVITGSTITASTNPATATALSILAGIARFPDGELIGRPAYVLENKQWDVATIRRLGNGAWQLTNPVPIKGVTVFVRSAVDPGQDGCNPIASFDREPQAQIVTASGTVTDTSSTPAKEYLSFNNGELDASSPLAAYEEGALSVTMPALPPGFYELSLPNQR